jgi:hypothetical protein
MWPRDFGLVVPNAPEVSGACTLNSKQCKKREPISPWLLTTEDESATILLRVENHSPKDTASCPIRLRVRRSDLHKWHNVHTKYRYYRSIERTVAAGGHQLYRLSGRNTGQKLQNYLNLVIYCNKLADDFGLNASNLPFLPKVQRT